MKHIQRLFDQSNVETLGVFDIDMVLLENTEPAFQMANMKQHKKVLKTLFEPLNAIERDLTLMLTLTQGQTVLMDPQTPLILKAIAQKHPKLIALTSTLTGPWGTVTDGTLFRYEQLKNVGIDFSNSFNHMRAISFTNSQPYRKHYPEFKQGILAANGEHKGEALVAFLKHTGYTPQRIIFVDDRPNNLEDVEKAINAHFPTITLITVLYQGAEKADAVIVDEITFKNAWEKTIEGARSF